MPRGTALVTCKPGEMEHAAKCGRSERKRHLRLLPTFETTDCRLERIEKTSISEDHGMKTGRPPAKVREPLNPGHCKSITRERPPEARLYYGACGMCIGRADGPMAPT